MRLSKNPLASNTAVFSEGAVGGENVTTSPTSGREKLTPGGSWASVMPPEATTVPGAVSVSSA